MSEALRSTFITLSFGVAVTLKQRHFWEIRPWEMCICSVVRWCEVRSPPGVRLVTVCFFMFVALVTVLSNKIWLCNQTRPPGLCVFSFDWYYFRLCKFYCILVSSWYCLKHGWGSCRSNGLWVRMVESDFSTIYTHRQNGQGQEMLWPTCLIHFSCLALTDLYIQDWKQKWPQTVK